MAYDVGDPVALAVRIRDTAGEPVNAESVTFRVTLPDLTVVEPVVANPPAETGRYAADYVATMPGRHTWRAVATNPFVAYEDSFDVRPVGATGLVSLRDAKRILRIPAASTENDDEIRQVVEAATALAEDATDRKILRQRVSETKTVHGPRYVLPLTHRPVIELVAVTDVDRPEAAPRPATDFDVDERGMITVLGGGPLVGRLRFVYIAGYAVVPANYREAIEHIVQHLWSNRRGRDGAVRVGGQETDPGDVDAGMGYSIPARAMDLLGQRDPLVG